MSPSSCQRAPRPSPAPLCALRHLRCAIAPRSSLRRKALWRLLRSLWTLSAPDQLRENWLRASIRSQRLSVVRSRLQSRPLARPSPASITRRARPSISVASAIHARTHIRSVNLLASRMSTLRDPSKLEGRVRPAGQVP
ncbi:hypothetical protein PsYK624_038170 [Phanerochaete sordida]|uniref:Uncharacterized protein n=1 Tax=Phanerochaete sordida TaxID=48140 RepID=A0A9P3G4K3_9APHY|nr:hypothetical protein PsYK624_038170 [Phanerochaete sordida]